jgi:RNA polymerase sigma-70 factor (ECF subfamily)
MHQKNIGTTYTIEDLQSGNRDAFAALVNVLQETFLKAFKNIDRFEGRSSIGTWLYRIATNEALMRLRKVQPDLVAIDEPVEMPDGHLITRELKDWCCIPESEFMTNEAQSKLDNAIADLSPALRSTFILRDLHGLSTRESAEIIGVSEAAIKTRLLRARLQLRDSLSIYFENRVVEIADE